MAGLELEEYTVSLADNNVSKSFIIVICILFPCSVSYPAPKNPNLSKTSVGRSFVLKRTSDLHYDSKLLFLFPRFPQMIDEVNKLVYNRNARKF
jgi:hypothetical protein